MKEFVASGLCMVVLNLSISPVAQSRTSWNRCVDSLRAVQAGSAKKTTKPYVSQEGGFSIEFPIPPDESSGVRQFPSGTMKIHHASCLDGAVIYGASYADFPQDIDHLFPSRRNVLKALRTHCYRPTCYTIKLG